MFLKPLGTEVNSLALPFQKFVCEDALTLAEESRMHRQYEERPPIFDIRTCKANESAVAFPTMYFQRPWLGQPRTQLRNGLP